MSFPNTLDGLFSSDIQLFLAPVDEYGEADPTGSNGYTIQLFPSEENQVWRESLAKLSSHAVMSVRIDQACNELEGLVDEPLRKAYLELNQDLRSEVILRLSEEQQISLLPVLPTPDLHRLFETEENDLILENTDKLVLPQILYLLNELEPQECAELLSKVPAERLEEAKKENVILPFVRHFELLPADKQKTLLGLLDDLSPLLSIQTWTGAVEVHESLDSDQRAMLKQAALTVLESDKTALSSIPVVLLASISDEPSLQDDLLGCVEDWVEGLTAENQQHLFVYCELCTAKQRKQILNTLSGEQREDLLNILQVGEISADAEDEAVTEMLGAIDKLTLAFYAEQQAERVLVLMPRLSEERRKVVCAVTTKKNVGHLMKGLRRLPAEDLPSLFDVMGSRTKGAIRSLTYHRQTAQLEKAKRVLYRVESWFQEVSSIQVTEKLSNKKLTDLVGEIHTLQQTAHKLSFAFTEVNSFLSMASTLQTSPSRKVIDMTKVVRDTNQLLAEGSKALPQLHKTVVSIKQRRATAVTSWPEYTYADDETLSDGNFTLRIYQSASESLEKAPYRIVGEVLDKAGLSWEDLFEAGIFSFKDAKARKLKDTKSLVAFVDAQLARRAQVLKLLDSKQFSPEKLKAIHKNLSVVRLLDRVLERQDDGLELNGEANKLIEELKTELKSASSDNKVT